MPLPTTGEQERLGKMQDVYLEALRHREQEFLKFAVILVSAVGLLLYVVADTEKNIKDEDSTVKSYRSLLTLPAPKELIRPTTVEFWVSLTSSLVLFLGGCYCLVLGYNYRYVTLMLAKIEYVLGVDKYTLAGWPKNPRQFIKKIRLKKIFPRLNSCTCKVLGNTTLLYPPEIILLFYIACIVAIGLIAGGTYWFACCSKMGMILFLINVVLSLLLLLLPVYYGRKFLKMCKDEKTWTMSSWNALLDY